MEHYAVSPQALRPLVSAFWSSRGWREPPELPSGEGLERAVADGVMFAEPVRRDHDGWVEAARQAADALALDDVADAFVGSLVSRRLDLRSALGSYVLARHLPEHRFRAMPSSGECAVCGLHEAADDEDLNVLSFERFRWGGVRHDDVRYAAFDLEQLPRAPREDVGDDAVGTGRALLDALRSVPAGETATAALPRLTVVRGNRDERASLLDVLGMAGVLATREHPGYLDAFVPLEERELPAHHYVERTYPVCWWRGADGVDEGAVRQLFARLT